MQMEHIWNAYEFLLWEKFVCSAYLEVNLCMYFTCLYLGSKLSVFDAAVVLTEICKSKFDCLSVCLSVCFDPVIAKRTCLFIK